MLVGEESALTSESRFVKKNLKVVYVSSLRQCSNCILNSKPPECLSEFGISDSATVSH